MILRKLAWCIILPISSGGHCIGLAVGEYASGDRGVQLDGTIVCHVVMYHPEHGSRMAQRLYPHSCGYLIEWIVEFTNQNN